MHLFSFDKKSIKLFQIHILTQMNNKFFCLPIKFIKLPIQSSYIESHRSYTKKKASIYIYIRQTEMCAPDQ